MNPKSSKQHLLIFLNDKVIDKHTSTQRTSNLCGNLKWENQSENSFLDLLSKSILTKVGI